MGVIFESNNYSCLNQSRSGWKWNQKIVGAHSAHSFMGTKTWFGHTCLESFTWNFGEDKFRYLDSSFYLHEMLSVIALEQRRIDALI